MKLLQPFIVFLSCALAQSALARLVPPLRLVRVDLCLIALVGYALRADEQRGFLLGVLAGLAMDLVGGGWLGVGMLGYGVVGVLVGGTEASFLRGALVARALVVLIAALILSGAVYYVLRALGPTPSYLTAFNRTLLPGAAATAVVAPLALAWMERRRHD
jgi:rod shape-determining protein MreD